MFPPQELLAASAYQCRRLLGVVVYRCTVESETVYLIECSVDGFGTSTRLVLVSSSTLGTLYRRSVNWYLVR